LGAIAVPLTLIIRENVFNVNIQGYDTLLPFVIFLALLVIFTHRKNVIRLLNGNENKVSFKKKNKSSR
jgi:glycerol-3-phosphate acyltransferase PlsY